MIYSRVPKKRPPTLFSIVTNISLYHEQATSQNETENWIHYIHTSAAAALARKRGQENIRDLLFQEMKSLQEKKQSDEKLMKMALLQMKIEKESHIRQNIIDQVIAFDQALNS